MWSVLKTIAFASVTAALGLSARAVVPDVSIAQYQSIPDRNVFGLKPPPALPTATNPPQALPKITLTGITTILGNKRALMKVAPAGLKPGDPKELSMILTEGQREGDIEVLQIDENRGSVKVNNSGTEMLLTFEKDGAKLPATTPATIPGRPPAPPLPSPLPTSVGIRTNPYAPDAHVVLPRRNPRNPNTPGYTGTAPTPVGGVPTPTGLTSAPAQAPQPDEDLTPEEQAIVLELQRQANIPNPAYQAPATTALNPASGQLIQPVNPGTTPASIPTAPQVLVPQ